MNKFDYQFCHKKTICAVEKKHRETAGQGLRNRSIKLAWLLSVASKTECENVCNSLLTDSWSLYRFGVTTTITTNSFYYSHVCNFMSQDKVG